MTDPTSTASAESLRQQLESANKDLSWFKARILTLEAWITSHLDKPPHHEDTALLHDLAEALNTTRELGRPAPPALPTDGQTIYRPKPGSRPPSGGNPRAREAHRKLHEAVQGALDRYGNEKERGYTPPSKEERDTLRLARRCLGERCLGVLGRGHQKADHYDDDGYSIGKCYGRNCLGTLRSGHTVGDHESEQVPEVPTPITPAQTTQTTSNVV